MKPEIVVIGSSQGGLSALEEIFKVCDSQTLPPVVLVMHRAGASREALKKLLSRRLGLPVTEPDDKEPIRPHQLYLAPAGYHLLVDKESFHLSTEASVHHSRPSIDVLFESAATAFGSAAWGIILSGASEDGAQGAAKLVDLGAKVLVQHPSTAENPIMPESATKAMKRKGQVMPPSEIGALLSSFRNGKGPSK